MSIISATNSIFPVPFLAVQPHNITEPYPCFIVGHMLRIRCFMLGFLCTIYFFPLRPNKFILVSPKKYIFPKIVLCMLNFASNYIHKISVDIFEIEHPTYLILNLLKTFLNVSVLWNIHITKIKVPSILYSNFDITFFT